MNGSHYYRNLMVMLAGVIERFEASLAIANVFQQYALSPGCPVLYILYTLYLIIIIMYNVYNI